MSPYDRYMLERCQENCEFDDIKSALDSIPYNAGRERIEQEIVQAAITVLANHGWIEVLHSPLEGQKPQESEYQEQSRMRRLYPQEVIA